MNSGEIKHFERLWGMNLINLSKKSLEDWNKFVLNENFQDREKQQRNIHALPDKKELLLPHWIMDRLKEAMDQYAKGQWLSSITLCGAIVEFLARSIPEAYEDKINKKLPKNLFVRLQLLKCYGILDEKDYKRLDEVRKSRNKIIHPELKKISKVSRGPELIKYQELLKSKNLKVLENLLDFFDKKNIFSKYSDYLKYLSQV